MAWLLALAVIAGASPVMAASYAGGDVTTLSNPIHSVPQAPSQAALDELYAAAVEDEGGRRLADSGAGDLPAIVAAVAAAAPFGLQPDAAAEHRTRPTVEVLLSCHKTGPPTA